MADQFYGSPVGGSSSKFNLNRLNSFDLSAFEIKGIQKALEEVEKQREEVENEGLSQVTFCAGILNVVMATAVFCKWPEYLWLFYGLECAVFVPAWWYKMAKDCKGVLFMLDYCWFTSGLFGVYMITSAFGLVPAWLHRVLVPIFYSSALGPMSWACLILFSGLVFHSLDKTASLFVHYTPTLVCYTFKYHMDAVVATMPNMPADALDPAKMVTYHNGPFPNYFFYIDNIFLAGWSYYFVWWSLHTLWLLSVGVYLPDKGYDTVFGNIYIRTGLGEILKNKTGLEDIRSHAAIYLAIHAAASSFSFFWAPAVFWEGTWVGGIIAGGVGGVVIGGLPGLFIGAAVMVAAVEYVMPLHMVWIIVVFWAAVWNGAGHYDYIFAKKYTKVLQAMLEDGREPLLASFSPAGK